MITIVEINLSTGHQENLCVMSECVAYRRNHAQRLANRYQREDTSSDHTYNVKEEANLFAL